MRQELMRRTAIVALLAGALFLLVYVLSVRTTTGQRFEDGILEAAQRVPSLDLTVFARYLLEKITNVTAALAVAAVVAIGLIRRRVALAVAAGGLIVASVVTTVIAQHVLTRPLLLSHGFRREDQSFPSGHVAIAVSVMCALVLVVPYRMRRVVAAATLLVAAGLAVATVVADWHRPGDTLGSDLIVVCYAGLALLALAGLGLVRPADNATVTGAAQWRPIGLALLAVVILAAAAWGRSPDGTGDPMIQPAGVPIASGWAFGLTLAGVAAGVVAVNLVLLALIRHIDVGARAEPAAWPARWQKAAAAGFKPDRPR